MPTYTFRDRNPDGTGIVFDIFLKLSARAEFIAEHPNLEQIITSAPGFNYANPMGVKPDSGFRDFLKDMKKANERGLTASTINTF